MEKLKEKILTYYDNCKVAEPPDTYEIINKINEIIDYINYLPKFWGIHKIDEDLKDYDFQDGDTIVFEVDEELVFDSRKYRKHNYFLDIYCMKDWHSVEKLTAHLEEL